jgi:hypothetical protein
MRSGRLWRLMSRTNRALSGPLTGALGAVPRFLLGLLTATNCLVWQGGPRRV